jgi:archaeal flagellar protein FlaG
MSSETITTALFLITAVIAAGVLINAVYPVVYNMAGTFSSATHESDSRMRTDFKVISAAKSGSTVTVWMKNIGSEPIPFDSITKADVFLGAVGSFSRLEYGDDWTAKILPAGGNDVWETGETLEITASTDLTGVSRVYFQFALPNGVWRSHEFTVS